MSITQKTKAILRTCVINGVAHLDIIDDALVENYAVHSLRIYEDICKPYFTAQLVIEDQVNSTDPFLYPAGDVEISFQCPPTSYTYNEKFKIYSIESKPKTNDLYGGMLITINLIGAEYFNDNQNTVIKNVSNRSATDEAKAIHNEYLGVNGALKVIDSLGAIGKDQYPHQVLNKKPIKAIHDLLDKAVSSSYKSGSFVYFRNKNGYVIGPLEGVMAQAGIKKYFVHKPAEGKFTGDILEGYENIVHFRPSAPPSAETAAGIRSSDIDSVSKTLSYFDAKSGFYKSIAQTSKSAASVFEAVSSAKNLAKAVKGLKNTAQKTQFGSRHLFNVINEDRQSISVDKNGPGGFQTAEQAFLAALSMTKKYWVSVPGQSGINVTIGDKISVVYPVGVSSVKSKLDLQQKTLFVARLIHEVQFKTPGQQRYEPAQAVTEMYGVEW